MMPVVGDKSGCLIGYKRAVDSEIDGTPAVRIADKSPAERPSQMRRLKNRIGVYWGAAGWLSWT
jgi:hypothetical protein